MLGNRIEHLTVLNKETCNDDRRAEIRRVRVGVDPVSNLIEYSLLVVSVLARLVVEISDLTGDRVESGSSSVALEAAELLLDDAVKLQDIRPDTHCEFKIFGSDLVDDSYRIHRQLRYISGDDAFSKVFYDSSDRGVEL